MILIVDDRPDNIYSLQKLLEINNFKVDTAASGEEALRKILRNTYFLIILDVQMPGMDGFEVAEAITGYSKSKDIPIIFLSAVNVEKRFIAKGYTSGAIDYITKPFDPDILLLKVSTFYRLNQQTRALNETQEALWQSLEELRSILESIQQIAFTLNAAGEIEFVNRYWYEYAADKTVFPEAEDGTPAVADCVRVALASGVQEVNEVRIRHISRNEYRYHLLSMTPVRKDDRIVKWVGIFTDIHEQKMINQLLENRVHERTLALQQANRELEISNHELQQFAYIASHDLKEPLRKIQVFSNLISGKIGEEQPEALHYLNRVVHSAERMNKLITDVLDYSKLSITSIFHVTDINTVIREIMDDMELLIAEKQALIHVDELLPLEVIPSQIRQVFQNIISNAIKFSRAGTQPVIHIRGERVAERATDSKVAPEGAWYRITVSDNGIGFDDTYRTRIFEIFQRLHGRNEYEGTGIGLAIVKKIIDTHNGLITAQSEPGNGSTFIMVLPVNQL